MNDYYQKYIKYKLKYLEAYNEMYGGLTSAEKKKKEAEEKKKKEEEEKKKKEDEEKKKKEEEEEKEKKKISYTPHVFKIQPLHF